MCNDTKQRNGQAEYKRVRIDDGDTVRVNGDISYAINQLKIQTNIYGTMRRLKARMLFPSVSQRRKAKRKKTELNVRNRSNGKG